MLALEVVLVGCVVGVYLGLRAPRTRDTWGYEEHLSDGSLREVFSAHKADFLALRDMILAEPRLHSVGDDNVGAYWRYGQTWHDSQGSPVREGEMLRRVGLAETRYSVYLQRLKRVGAYRVTTQGGEVGTGEAAIHVYRAGMGISGEGKDIVFLLDPPEHLADNTDSAMGNKTGLWYSRLEEDWYIKFWRS